MNYQKERYWDKIGIKNSHKTPNKIKNTSLLSAISYDGLEGYMLIKGGFSKEMFNYFLIKLIMKYK